MSFEKEYDLKALLKKMIDVINHNANIWNLGFDLEHKMASSLESFKKPVLTTYTFEEDPLINSDFFVGRRKILNSNEDDATNVITYNTETGWDTTKMELQTNYIVFGDPKNRGFTNDGRFYAWEFHPNGKLKKDMPSLGPIRYVGEVDFEFTMEGTNWNFQVMRFKTLKSYDSATKTTTTSFSLQAGQKGSSRGLEVESVSHLIGDSRLLQQVNYNKVFKFLKQ